jgi:hypothetical protein
MFLHEQLSSYITLEEREFQVIHDGHYLCLICGDVDSTLRCQHTLTAVMKQFKESVNVSHSYDDGSPPECFVLMPQENYLIRHMGHNLWKAEFFFSEYKAKTKRMG